MKTKLKRLVIFCLVTTSLYWITGCALQRKLIFPASIANRHMINTNNPGYWLTNLEKIWLKHGEGQTEVWLIKPPGGQSKTLHHPSGEQAGLSLESQSKQPGQKMLAGQSEMPPVVIFAHGNAELIDGEIAIIKGFTDRGYAVAMCEFRGYGRSAGSPSQENITADYVAMIDILKKRNDLDASRIIYYGRSLGGGIVCSVARQRKPSAIILQSTFTSINAMAAKMWIPSFFVADPMNSEDFLKTYKLPILLMHGVNDTIIPFAHAQSLKKVAPHAILHQFVCGHNDFPVSSAKHWQHVDALLKLVRAKPQSSK